MNRLYREHSHSKAHTVPHPGDSFDPKTDDFVGTHNAMRTRDLQQFLTKETRSNTN
jgi:hypothetical protein